MLYGELHKSKKQQLQWGCPKNIFHSLLFLNYDCACLCTNKKLQMCSSMYKYTVSRVHCRGHRHELYVHKLYIHEHRVHRLHQVAFHNRVVFSQAYFPNVFRVPSTGVWCWCCCLVRLCSQKHEFLLYNFGDMNMMCHGQGKFNYLLEGWMDFRGTVCFCRFASFT